MPEEDEAIGEAIGTKEVVEKAEEPTAPTPEGAPAPAAPRLLTQEEVSTLVAAEKTRWERHFQSVAGKQIAEVRKLAQAREERLRAELVQMDPERANTIALEDYQQRDKAKEAEEAQQKAQDEFSKAYYGPILTVLTELGISPSDATIDWGTDAPDFQAAHQRVHASIAKVLKARETKLRVAHQQAEKDAEMRVRKELGLDSVDKTMGVGGDANWRKKSPLEKVSLGLAEEAAKAK